MKKLFTRPVYFLLLLIIVLLSCNKPPIPRDPYENGGPVNKSPIASAGDDQTITLPTDSVVLNGSGSFDRDGSISNYWWNKIAGPSSYVIIDSTLPQTTAKNLIEGVYMFELTVKDDKGLTANDIVEITVNPAISYGCNGSTRPVVNITLTEIGSLSQPRIPCVAAAGNKIVFAGGPYVDGPWYYISSAVDIYDVNSKTWSTAALSQPREGIASVSCGNKIFFAGGGYWDGAVSNIDIYDVLTGIWTRTDLSVPRSYLTGATIGNKVFFAGGFTEGWQASSRVDIYDLSADAWTTTELSQPRNNLSAVSAGDKIYFAGGAAQDNNSHQVDIYNNATNSWATSTLQELSGLISGVALGQTIYWGGINQIQNTGKVEIWNTANGSLTFDCLSYPRYSPTAITKNDNVIFFTSSDWNNEINLSQNLRKEIDIHNTTTGQWFVGILPHSVVAPGIITVNNSLYMGGGRTGTQSCTDKVYILNW